MMDLLTAFVVSTMAHAAAPTTYRIRICGGVSSLAGLPAAEIASDAAYPYDPAGPSLGGGLMGGILLHGARFAADLSARELYATEDARMVGALFFGARYTPLAPAHLRLGFAHSHETPMAVVEQSVSRAILGSAEGIRHRSGLELGIGVSTTPPEVLDILGGLGARLGLAVDLSAAWFPDDNGPRAYVYLDLSSSIGIGEPGSWSVSP